MTRNADVTHYLRRMGHQGLRGHGAQGTGWRGQSFSHMHRHISSVGTPVVEWWAWRQEAAGNGSPVDLLAGRQPLTRPYANERECG